MKTRILSVFIALAALAALALQTDHAETTGLCAPQKAVVLHISPAPESAMNRNETVVLIHGLVRSSRSLKRMAGELQRAGYSVINVDYPSRTASVEQLTKQLFTTLIPRIENAERVHFVTHSLGGILLRQHLQEHDLPNLGRVVMLAPPSRGSEVTDRLGGIFLYKWINGPAGNQLGTGSKSLPLRLSSPEFELGVIAGDRSINPILSLLIPGPDDGKVAVARAAPPECNNLLVLHATHACMMRNRTVIDQTEYFLQTGQFRTREASHD